MKKKHWLLIVLLIVMAGVIFGDHSGLKSAYYQYISPNITSILNYLESVEVDMAGDNLQD